MLGLIDHIGVATRDIDHAIEILRKTGGIEVGRRGSVSAFQVEMVMVAAGGAPIELIQPTSPESPVAAFMEKRGEGVHHVAYRVDDLEAALRECRNQGLNLIDESPREGYGGSRVAFIHPKAMLGILTELVERPGGRDVPPYDPI